MGYFKPENMIDISKEVSKSRDHKLWIYVGDAKKNCSPYQKPSGDFLQSRPVDHGPVA